MFAGVWDHFETAFVSLAPSSYRISFYTNGSDVSRAMGRRRMRIAVRRLWLCSLPTQPEEGRWTSTGPALDGIYLSDGICGVIFDLTENAFDKLHAEDIVLASDANHNSRDGGCQTFSWHEVAGSRLRDAKLLKSPSNKLEVAALNGASSSVFNVLFHCADVVSSWMFVASLRS